MDRTIELSLTNYALERASGNQSKNIATVLFKSVLFKSAIDAPSYKSVPIHCRTNGLVLNL